MHLRNRTRPILDSEMKTCGTCRHYYAAQSLCEAPLPMWLTEADPLAQFTGDNIRTQQPDCDAEACRTYAKHRKRPILDSEVNAGHGYSPP